MNPGCPLSTYRDYYHKSSYEAYTYNYNYLEPSSGLLTIRQEAAFEI